MSRPTRAAFVTYEFPPYVNGGAGTYAAELVTSLVGLGVDVTVFGPRGSQLVCTRVIPVSDFSGGVVPFWLRLPRVVLGCSRREGRFDVIHANSLSAVSLPKSTAAGARVTTIHHLTRGLVEPGPRGLLSRLKDIRGETAICPPLEALEIRRADVTIAVSSLTRDDIMEQYGIPSSRIAVIPNGVRAPRMASVETIQATREELLQSGELLVLAVGRLEARKGIDILLRAFRLLCVSRPARLALVGAGDSGPYRRMAADLGVGDRVVFAGRVSDSRLADLFQAADLYVSASRREGFNLAAFEAMAAGTPVVGTSTGMLPAALSQIDPAAIAPVGDVEGLTRALIYACASTDRMKVTGASAAKWVEANLSWEDAGQATINTYERAIYTRSRASLPAPLEVS